MIMKAPSPNIMNKLARSVLALYSYDEDPEGQSLENLMRQSIGLIASLPTIMVNAYQIKRRVYDRESMFWHLPQPGQSTAEHILATNRADQKFTREEARLLDLCLVLHADHGGGNNSTFTCRVLSSAGTDTYSAIAAAIGSLKGARHGGANHKVMEMLDGLLAVVPDPDDEAAVTHALRRILRKEAGDGSGLIYGIGHAVYTKSDPRAVILRRSAHRLAEEKGFARELRMLCAVERLGPVVMREEKGVENICANVDLFSGLIYRMLGLSEDLFTRPPHGGGRLFGPHHAPRLQIPRRAPDVCAPCGALSRCFQKSGRVWATGISPRASPSFGPGNPQKRPAFGHSQKSRPSGRPGLKARH